MTTALNETDIKHVVQSFYTRVRQDELLGPIFATKIQGDAAWDRHMAHIADFWSSIFLKTGRYKGNPLQKHIEVHGLTPALFSHWLALFQDTAARILAPEQAEEIHQMAQRIAQSLQMGLAFNYEKNGDTEHPFKDFGLGSRG